MALAACNQPAPAPRTGQAGPRVQAKVLTIHTTLLPDAKSFQHLVIVADGKVRLGNETNRWRLFDISKDTVTFVDDVAKTYRTSDMKSLLAARNRILEGEAPAPVVAAKLTLTGRRGTFAGIEATEYVMQLGAYRRNVWFSTKPVIGGNFNALMTASEEISEPFAPALRDVLRQLVTLKDYPVLDHAEMPLDGKTLVVEKRLLKVENRSVPAAWISIPAGYRDVTAAAGSGADRPRAGSRGPGPAARAAE